MVGPPGRTSAIRNISSRFSSPADVVLALRIMGWALALPIVKRVVPVRSLARVMHQVPKASVRDAAREDRIVTFARWAARLIRWKSGGNCLERGLIAYRYLGAANAQPLLVVGLDRQEAGELIGHAWVIVDGRPAGETAASLIRYTPVFAFGPDGALIDVPRTGGPSGE